VSLAFCIKIGHSIGFKRRCFYPKPHHECLLFLLKQLLL
jgi:hypothetical protein